MYQRVWYQMWCNTTPEEKAKWSEAFILLHHHVFCVLRAASKSIALLCARIVLHCIVAFRFSTLQRSCLHRVYCTSCVVSVVCDHD